MGIFDWLLVFYALAAVSTTLCAVLAVEVFRLRRTLAELRTSTKKTAREVDAIKKRLEVLIRNKAENIDAEDLKTISRRLAPANQELRSRTP